MANGYLEEGDIISYRMVSDGLGKVISHFRKCKHCDGDGFTTWSGGMTFSCLDCNGTGNALVKPKWERVK
jgi:DnaJ-class molecular chaperone